MSDPATDFVRFFAKQVYSGHLTASVFQQFADVTRRAMHQFVSDRISERLKSALENETEPSKANGLAPSAEVVDNGTSASGSDKAIVTTAEEMEAFYIVKSILREVVDIKRVYPHDTASYFDVLLDNNNRKPICRLRFNFKQKYVSVLDKDKNEEKVAIDDLNDIYGVADRLKAAVATYETATVASKT
jgi:hypothetical protein